MPVIHFYDQDNFQGAHDHLTGNWYDLRKLQKELGNWNDEIRSIWVESGRWRVFEHTDFHGAYATLGPGHYSNGSEMGIGADTISSIEVNPPANAALKGYKKTPTPNPKAKRKVKKKTKTTAKRKIQKKAKKTGKQKQKKRK